MTEAVGRLRVTGRRRRPNVHSADHVAGPEGAGEGHTCTGGPEGSRHTGIHTDWGLPRRVDSSCAPCVAADSRGGAVHPGEGPEEGSHPPSRYGGTEVHRRCASPL